jgi:type II secretory pathway pseudopilin PulG
VTITILNFHGNQDIIDLSGFSSPSSLGEVSYRTSPLVLLLGDGQEVVLSSYDLFDLSETNFIFTGSPGSGTGGTAAEDPLRAVNSIRPASLVNNSEIIFVVVILAVLLLSTLVFCQLNSHVEKKAKKRKEAFRLQRIYQLTSGNDYSSQQHGQVDEEEGITMNSRPFSSVQTGKNTEQLSVVPSFSSSPIQGEPFPSHNRDESSSSSSYASDPETVEGGRSHSSSSVSSEQSGDSEDSDSFESLGSSFASISSLD